MSTEGNISSNNIFHKLGSRVRHTLRRVFFHNHRSAFTHASRQFQKYRFIKNEMALPRETFLLNHLIREGAQRRRTAFGHQMYDSHESQKIRAPLKRFRYAGERPMEKFHAGPLPSGYVPIQSRHKDYLCPSSFRWDTTHMPVSINC